jgi:Nif-specific regulatory protein
VVVDCAAVTEAEVESDLFGHEEAVLGGSREVRPGKLELTCGGTFLLGEIGHLGLDAQAGLLRLLDERVVVRAGGPTPIESDVRLLAATSRDLAELVRQQRFREDLYFRLNVVTLHLPPLRDRPADVLPLAEHFLADFCRQAHRKAPEFSTAARKRLNEYAWPGNVRQLRNLMERLAYLLAGDHIEAEDLDFTLSPRGKSPQPGDLSQPLAAATAQFQTEYIRRMIEASEGRMSRAAERLGLHRSNLYRKMGQLGMEPPADSK